MPRYAANWGYLTHNEPLAINWASGGMFGGGAIAPRSSHGLGEPAHVFHWPPFSWAFITV